jgi:hypothetical protein
MGGDNVGAFFAVHGVVRKTTADSGCRRGNYEAICPALGSSSATDMGRLALCSALGSSSATDVGCEATAILLRVWDDGDDHSVCDKAMNCATSRPRDCQLWGIFFTCSRGEDGSQDSHHDDLCTTASSWIGHEPAFLRRLGLVPV